MPNYPHSSSTSAGSTATATQYNNVRKDALTRPAGIAEVFFGAVADVPSGALLCDGKTIGSASSGGTARANADMEDLFTRLWNATTNSELVIQDSTGANTTRGASAAADFSANKRLPLPDMRGNIPLGMDNMNASARNRVNAAEADTLADEAGAETINLQHNHSLPPVVSGDRAGGGDWAYELDDVGYPGATGNNLSTTQSIMPPFISVRWIIWTGVYW